MEDVRVALLEQKVEDLKPIILKIDFAIEKLSEVNTTVSRMLAVHEERISKQEEVDNILFAKIDKLRDKVDINNDSLFERVRELEKRVWMAIGALTLLTILSRIPTMLEILTPQTQSSIIQQRNFKV
jgi:hypothetical protein